MTWSLGHKYIMLILQWYMYIHALIQVQQVHIETDKPLLPSDNIIIL